MASEDFFLICFRTGWPSSLLKLNSVEALHIRLDLRICPPGKWGYCSKVNIGPNLTLNLHARHSYKKRFILRLLRNEQTACFTNGEERFGSCETKTRFQVVEKHAGGTEETISHIKQLCSLIIK